MIAEFAGGETQEDLKLVSAVFAELEQLQRKGVTIGGVVYPFELLVSSDMKFLNTVHIFWGVFITPCLEREKGERGGGEGG